MRGRADSVQGNIVRALREMPGVSVHVLSSFPGCLDLLVGFRGRTYWFEIKAPGKEDRLTDVERRILSTWTGHCAVATSIEDIIEDILGRDYGGSSSRDPL